MTNKSIQHTITCDLCGKTFRLTPEVLKENTVTLRKDNKDPYEVVLTTLSCPCCGKSYPIIMDDAVTARIAEKLRAVVTKQVKQIKKGFNPSPELEKKRKALNWRLDFKRQKLADEYNGAFYQLEDGTMEQLDYRYHAR